jgi:hypothetical protein
MMRKMRMRRKKMAIRIIIVSDTHGKHDLIRDLPESDIFIHSGDFMNSGIYLEEITSFNAWLKGIPAKHKKFFFSPYTPEFFEWAFNVKRGPDIKKYWDQIPDDTEFLVTHGPPYGILDEVVPGDRKHLGCGELLKRVQNLPKLRYHAFGHIHGSRGVLQNSKGPLFINASVLNERYNPHKGAGFTYLEVEW